MILTGINKNLFYSTCIAPLSGVVPHCIDVIITVWMQQLPYNSYIYSKYNIVLRDLNLLYMFYSVLLYISFL